MQLLEDWPEHPGLLALSAVIDRLLGLPVSAPLKAVLTGVELLLAKAQLWEETAARHVSIAPQLAPLSALATRWRRLELAGWRGLLDVARRRSAAAAHQVGPCGGAFACVAGGGGCSAASPIHSL